jgi:HlyD family secretion protein
VEIEAGFDNIDDCMHLLPGYSADVEVILAVAEDVLRVPSDAVMEGNRVLVFKRADGLLQEQVIETGITNWQWTEVASGLSAGELVVTSVSAEGVEAGVYGKSEQQLPEPGATQ